MKVSTLGCRCPHCWCASHFKTWPPLWTAKQAADDCGCSPVSMGHEMSKWFKDKKYLRDSKVTVYCVHPGAQFAGDHNGLGSFADCGNKTLIEKWREHTETRATREI